MAREKTAEAAPAPRTAAADENQGLAARLVELRRTVEDNRKDAVRDMGELKTELARISDRQARLGDRLDKAMAEVDRRQRDLDQQLRTGAEQVRASGELARKMNDHMRVLDELREVQADPHEVVKPLQRQIAQLDADVKTVRKHVDLKFEQLPKPRAEPWESRGADEVARREKYEAEQRRIRSGAA